MKKIIIIALAVVVLLGGAFFVLFGDGDPESITPSDVESQITIENEADASFEMTEDGVVYTGGDIHTARTQFLVAHSSNNEMENVLIHDSQIEVGDVVITPAQMVGMGEGSVNLAWKPYENEEFSSEWHELSSIYISQQNIDDTGMQDATQYDEEVGEDDEGVITGIGDVELEVTEDGVMYYGNEISEQYDIGNVFYEYRGDRTVVSDDVPQDGTLLVEGNEIASSGIAPGSKLYFVFSPIDSDQQFLGVITIPEDPDIIESWGFMSANIDVEERGFVYANGTIDNIYDSGGGIQIRHNNVRTDTYDGVPENNETIATPEQITDIPVPPETDVRVEYTNGNEEYFLDNVQTPSREEGSVGEEWPYIDAEFLVNANGVVYVDGELDAFDDGKLVMKTKYNRHTVYEGIPEPGETVASDEQLRRLGVPLGQEFTMRLIDDGDVYDLGTYEMPSKDDEAIIGTWDYIEGDVVVVDDGIEYRGDPEADFGEFDGGQINIDFGSKRDRHVYTGIPDDRELIVDGEDIAEHQIQPNTVVNVYFTPEDEDLRLFVGSVTTPEPGTERGYEWGYGDGESGSISIDGIIDPIVSSIMPPYSVFAV